MFPRSSRTAALVALLSALALSASGTAVAAEEGPVSTVPIVTPTPQQITPNGRDVRVPREVALVLGAEVDQSTEDLVRRTLRQAGAHDIRVDGRAELTVVVGAIDDPVVADALADAGGERPDELVPEGYSLAGAARGRGGLVALAGNDGDGVYYAAQTFRQLARDGALAAVSVVDHPVMALRGSIEGFYGAPWSHADRLDQLAFYGDVKANTYVYTPKDDLYLRERWREPYPAEDLDELEELVTEATTHHVQFTYAVSPGLSICYSDPADLQSLTDKLDSLYQRGVRSFYVAFDDIDYTEWNCAGDREHYGEPGQAAAGRAQAELLNAVQRGYLDTLPDANPLQMVPTEYSDVEDSPYKTVLRETLDERIVIQWTGTDVVPSSITVEDAERAAQVWGRKVYLWDNYPVNDFGQTAGRLLLAPYDKRDAELDSALSGIVLNPMNQAAPSKVALFGGASFAWNSRDYDADTTWRAAADYLADGDPDTARALLAFFDTSHLAPTFGEVPWQPQSPALQAEIDAVRDQPHGEPLDRLRERARLLATASEQIRAGVDDPAFAAQTRPWLDALTLWGGALESTIDGIDRAEDDPAGADRAFAHAAELAREAAAIQTIPGTTRPQGPIKIADGVLDVFIADAPGLVGRG
ncbi:MULTISPECIES: beta-N-acetylhexosaminidase family protein [Actinoalloteichus]|uniref:Glycosyl hydrolase family 20, domain 2/beta-N-acetylglucosaminidase n=1 Tax=Actinoalloteichus fjordicus TaxID=1612552 RepID=A0AAC9LEU0_9PSEU|nr:MULTISPECIES: beta-N-acetylglucosaminidase domain-containing protein [Actinoalloteichus]APU14924.1 Glycosyl hydrolase family 20, domain 2/beta-N-acetylglucosaminidase [Actinoalloteichus fjordicus]APU20994.1 Glycosyl hydrolase family 20, domain 2/beta-N-acetylglucosaminidase [Actinoalloteichus sp. GBA129-24]